jgi:protein-S-isoprenylcysteine O-methyltransferase Ste14
MKAENTVEQQGLDRSGKKRIVQVAFYFLLSGALLFVSAGRWNWIEAWIYLGVGIVLAVFGGILVIRKNPAVINERGRNSENTKGWDKVFGAVTVPLIFGFLIVAGLDFRFGWSVVPWWAKAAAFIALVPGSLFPYWAMLNNPFLAQTVRVEEDRGHRVATEGPYQFVRHPMYTGVILSWLAGPIFLGSWWALLSNGLAIMALIIRTILEDRTLQAELTGYAEYSRQVPYRLVPRLW